MPQRLNRIEPDGSGYRSADSRYDQVGKRVA